jgi:hypothetical protein
VALAVTARRFEPFVDGPLWKRLEMTWPSGMSQGVREGLYARNIQRLVMEIISKGDKRRFGLVRAVSVTPRAGAIIGIIMLLQLVSANLVKLELGSAGSSPFSHMVESLDIKLLGSLTYFESLTHIRLANGSIRYAETLLLLVDAAPELISLDVDPQHRQLPPWEDEDLPSYSVKHVTTTKIRDLRVAFGDHFANPLSVGHEAVYYLLKHSTDVRQLAVMYDTKCNSLFEALMVIVQAAGEYVQLEHLCWRDGARDFMNEAAEDEGTDTFKDVRILILKAIDLVQDLVSCPHWVSMD